MTKGRSSREDFSPNRRRGYPVDGLRKKIKQKVIKGNTSWTRKKRSNKSGTMSKNTTRPPIVWESPRGKWPFDVPCKRPPLEFVDNIIKKKEIKVSEAKDDTRIKVNFIIAGKMEILQKLSELEPFVLQCFV
uniref:Uncharacterized protein n=1 Tax=Panagrolaimus davidi TaxID=227884 RepID=A0A914PX76_9BILA